MCLQVWHGSFPEEAADKASRQQGQGTRLDPMCQMRGTMYNSTTACIAGGHLARLSKEMIRCTIVSLNVSVVPHEVDRVVDRLYCQDTWWPIHAVGT